MTLEFHEKAIYVNASRTQITSSAGTSLKTKPIFVYKDQILIKWTVTDDSGNAVNLTGSTFEFKIISEYSTQLNLTTSANSSFVSGDWASWSLSGGKICCRVDMNKGAIATWLAGGASDTAYCGLWATITGKSYLLAQFDCTIKNSIS